jgi:hypothetical protein
MEKKIWNVLNFWAKMMKDNFCPNQELSKVTLHFSFETINLELWPKDG